VQDSNPQPTVLETVALPIELTPFEIQGFNPKITWFRDATDACGTAGNISSAPVDQDRYAGFSR
jgi:hypothetical protein